MQKKRFKVPSILVACLAFVFWCGLQSCSQKDDDYPLDTCVVTDKKLGEMGKPFVHTHNRTKVKFCCKPCLKKFNKDPETYLAKLQK